MSAAPVATSSNGDASAALVSAAQAVGINVAGLNIEAQLQLCVANLLQWFPALAGSIPAASLTAGTVGTGAWIFPTSVQAGAPGAIAELIGGAAAAATTGATLIKKVTGIADNTATTVLTITVPNAAHAALVQVTIVGIAGAAGAIGACECVTGVTYNISVARTPGVAMGATVSTAFGSAAAVVVGAGTMTTVGAITLVGEGVTVANTGVFKATIDASATADNHVCLVYARVLNANATGITIS